MAKKEERTFQVLVIDASNRYIAVFDDIVSLGIRLQWGADGIAVLTVPEGHGLLEYNTLDQLLFITMPYPTLTGVGMGRALPFKGLIRDSQISTDDWGNVYHNIYVRHLNEVLSRYVIGYPSGMNNKTSWVGQRLSVIANDLVLWNATIDGTVANGRLRDTTVIRGLEDAGALAGTPVVNYSVDPGRPLMEVLNEIGRTLNFWIQVDFQNNPTIDLRVIDYFYVRQVRGSNRSAYIHLAIPLDNIRNPSLAVDNSREKTVAVVGGMGKGVGRTFAVRTGANYALSNDKEFFVDGSTYETIELDTLGDLALRELRARMVVNLETVELTGLLLDRDFFLGDLVTVTVEANTDIWRVNAVEYVWDQGLSPVVDLELTEPDV